MHAGAQPNFTMRPPQPRRTASVDILLRHVPRIAKESAIFQYKIIISQGQFSIISALSIGVQMKTWYLCCRVLIALEVGRLDAEGVADKLDDHDDKDRST